MNGSRAWTAAQKAWSHGAAYAGCSAGAMILAQGMPDFRRAGFGTLDAFGLIPASFILPHFDSIPAIWKPFVNMLAKRLKDGESMLGIDEETAIVGTLDGAWQVHGHQTVTRFTRTGRHVYKVGESVPLQ